MKQKSISFVLPMYNELKNIESSIDKAISVAKELCDDYEVIVADDASTDGSGELIDEMALKNRHIKPIHLEVNTKFGGALKKGLEAATKEVVIYTDSDFPAKDEDIKIGVGLLDGADVVTGYSLVTKDDSLRRIIISKVYNFLVETLFGLHIRDINSGLKIFKKDVLEEMNLVSKSPFIDVEIFLEARKRNFKISQFGLIFQLRTKGKSIISRSGVIARTFLDMIYCAFFR